MTSVTGTQMDIGLLTTIADRETYLRTMETRCRYGPTRSSPRVLPDDIKHDRRMLLEHGMVCSNPISLFGERQKSAAERKRHSRALDRLQRLGLIERPDRQWCRITDLGRQKLTDAAGRARSL